MPQRQFSASCLLEAWVKLGEFLLPNTLFYAFYLFGYDHDAPKVIWRYGLVLGTFYFKIFLYSRYNFLPVGNCQLFIIYSSVSKDHLIFTQTTLVNEDKVDQTNNILLG